MRLRINGTEQDVPAAPHERLAGVLRGRLGLTGTKVACARGECGACTVLIDGELAYACLTLAGACEGAEITTVEGLAQGGALHPLQQAFVEHDALQCGMCTPGQLMAAAALLAADPAPTDEAIARWMSGNLCRCGAYPKIAAAVRDAAARLREPRG
ncbi:MAG TPA: (2Fe-2S)-binding protein [Gemmatimonadaceae bacterium]|nr:(2Fe-2S)-binding protein [Gemmatimonadaceae bacterium]